MVEWQVVEQQSLVATREARLLMLLLALMGVQEIQATRACGQPHISLNRIVKGQDAMPGEFPWQISLQLNKRHVCGGSLISEDWVITAAHCFYQFRDLSQYQVLLGVTQLSNPGPQACCLGVKQVIINPAYAGQTTSGDIALVQLSRKVNYSDLILPICLPDASVNFPPGKLCWVTGWGNLRNSVDLPSPQILQKLQVPIIDSETCAALYRTNMGDGMTPRNIKADMICAGFAEGRKDACKGDSGGPMVCQVGHSWVLAGIVSWGEGCAIENRPGVYSRLTYYQKWIHSYIRDIEFVKDPNRRDLRNGWQDTKTQMPLPGHAASFVVSTVVFLVCLLILI
ncbi:serine protease 27-like [Hemicordylus capensis]|uniref:serine protease 27-like n=1 Tax=Hemicordylus capensis TaxID=884348 RepID=UPI0023036B69|nr:serine protease 27-like [Hemicordylus capensis]